MKISKNKKSYFFAILLISVFLTTILYAYSSGVTGLTLKSGTDGCFCHGSSASSEVNVIINGPNGLKPGETALYSVSITGGPLDGAGINLAASLGILNSVDTTLQIIGDELTHTSAKVPTGDEVIFQFSYTAPNESGIDTIYATGNSVNNLGNSSGDSWNFAPNKIIEVNINVPVELENLSADIVNKNVILKWSTVTETNNYGFSIERYNLNSSHINDLWEKIGFVKGAGNSLEKQNYSFEDKSITAGVFKYRIKQLDFNGTFKYYNLEKDISVTPYEFLLSQNYPNPFNPETTIEYNLITDAKVILTIYNSLGEKVAELVNEFQKSGGYSVKFNSSRFAGRKDLTSGVYYYVLNISALDNQNIFTDTKKMLLIK